MDVIKDLQSIKQNVIELKGRVNTGDPIVFLDLALTRGEIESWLEETEERLRLLKEILAVLKEIMREVA